jgi:glutamate/tyrosine decarboxylase-like PLP-dependent enzyme
VETRGAEPPVQAREVGGTPTGTPPGTPRSAAQRAGALRPPSTTELLYDAARRGAHYLATLPGRRVAPTPEAVSELAEACGGPLPPDPVDPREVIDLLDEVGSPATMAMAGPRYFGFVVGGALPVTVAASWLGTAWDQNGALHATSPAVAELERIALGWVVDLLGLPAGTAGGFVTGATVANLTALAAARHALLARAGWDVEEDGLFGAPEITVVVGEEAHTTLRKALAMLGLGRSRVITVPADAQGRMRADSLPCLHGRTILCLQAGHMATGAFDPAAGIVPRARAEGAWVHVDGAFGLWAAASARLAPLVAGFAEADSWTVDGHKWLNVPYDSGIAMVRDGEALRAAMSVRAPYLPQSAGREPSDHTPELSRRGRGIEVWAALRALGRSGVSALLERSCRQARRFAAGLGAAGHEVLNDVVLNQVLVSFGSDERTLRTIAALQREGTCWCGGTTWHGRTAMRISVCSWATTDEDVERSLEAILRVAASLA